MVPCIRSSYFFLISISILQSIVPIWYSYYKRKKNNKVINIRSLASRSVGSYLFRSLFFVQESYHFYLFHVIWYPINNNFCSHEKCLKSEKKRIYIISDPFFLFNNQSSATSSRPCFIRDIIINYSILLLFSDI